MSLKEEILPKTFSVEASPRYLLFLRIVYVANVLVAG